MQKTCQKCNQPFECNMENITQCQCYGITLNEADKKLIATEFTDCLCKNCLLSINEKSKELK